MINRRNFLGITAGAGATLALSPTVLRALKALEQQGGKLIQRAIPSTGEMLPAVGLSFSNHPVCADHAVLKEILRTFAANGGRVFDAMQSSLPASEQFHIDAARELGIQNKLFWSMSGAPAVGPKVDSLLARIGIPKIDLVMAPARDDLTRLNALKEEKKAGRVRYIGVQVIAPNFYPQLESIMKNEPIDFIGVDYDIGKRERVEDVILPLAQERKIAVLAYFPFGNNGGADCSGGLNLFGRVGSRPVPEWAAEFDATSWAQFFLKYVISHPAVTAARVGTTKAQHMADNMAGGIGRLPNEATRKRMAELIDSFPKPARPGAPPPQATQGPPVVLSVAVLERYVGEYKAGSGMTVTVRREGTSLFARQEKNPESPLTPRSETLFQIAQLPVNIEFKVDAQGKVTGATLLQGAARLELVRN
jgi:aryl-alcohol dehydrogenase-like predicted oxidoreductase